MIPLCILTLVIFLLFMIEREYDFIMSKWPIEWIVIIGLVLLFIAVKYPLLLVEAAAVIIIWRLLSKSTPKSMKEEERDSNFIPAEETGGPQSETEGPECKKSDAFYSGVNGSDAIYNRSAEFVTPKRPIEKSIE